MTIVWAMQGVLLNPVGVNSQELKAPGRSGRVKLLRRSVAGLQPESSYHY